MRYALSQLRWDPARTLAVGAYTAFRMRPRQLLGIGERTIRELLVPRLPVNFDRRYERRVPTDPSVRLDAVAADTDALRDALGPDRRRRYRTSAREAADGAPTFLNRSVRISDGRTVEWYADEFDELPALWRMKLYAFQPLSSAVRGFAPTAAAAEHGVTRTFDGWIDDWMETVSIGGSRYLRRAWTPWAVSLRIQHWIRYLTWRRRVGSSPVAPGFETDFLRSIYKNALFLRNHIEYDVDGNHLIENGTALLAAGLVFEGDDHDWLETGVSVLEDAATEQFLDDGCHYERSPMYHILVLTRLLSARHLLERSGRSVPGPIRTVTDEASAFLRRLRPPNGRIPLLNDSVYGEAIPVDACLRYAECVGVDGRNQEPTDADIADPPKRSGYHWLQAGDTSVLVDGGGVGPPHLPGHSHSDLLSVLLWIDDTPVVTDTGTFAYVAGERRNYARGVAGHNTVQVGDSEPIAVAGRYLMGPHPIPKTRIDTGPVSVFEGKYDAQPIGAPGYTHLRAIYAGSQWLVIDDAVAGGTDRPVRGRLHLHPDVSISTDGGTACVEVGDRTVSVHPLGGTRLDVGQSEYFPRFGDAIERPVLEYDDGNDRSGVAVACVVDRSDDVMFDVEDRRFFRLGNDEYRLPSLEFGSIR